MSKRLSRSIPTLAKGIGSVLCLAPQAESTQPLRRWLSSKSALDLYSESFASIGNCYSESFKEISALFAQKQNDQFRQILAEFQKTTAEFAKQIREIQLKRNQEIHRCFQEASKAQARQLRRLLREKSIQHRRNDCADA